MAGNTRHIASSRAGVGSAVVTETSATKTAMLAGVGAFQETSAAVAVTATTWSTTDKVNTTLSGSNLTATATAAGGVRGNAPKRTGSYYWETTIVNRNNLGVGLASGTANLSNGAATPLLIVEVAVLSGSIWVNSSNVANGALGARANGDIIGHAVNLDAQLYWARVAPSGNWNGSATANPATATGGLSIVAASLGGGFNAYPFAGWNNASEGVTANFGATAFSGTAPSGFTSGWDASVTAATSEIVTQVAVEHWATAIPPDMQVTQLAVEQWGPIVSPIIQLTQLGIEQWTVGTPAAQLSQLGIEQWASVGLSPSQAMLTQLGVEQWARGTPAAQLTQLGIEQWAPVLVSLDASPTLTGVAATGAAGTMSVSITRVVTLTGTEATGAAGTIAVAFGPVVFLSGAQATGQAGGLYAIAGGVRSKFKFIMQGVF